MPNYAADRGGGQLSNRLPDNVEAALAAIKSYIAEERDALDSLKSVNGDKIHCGDDLILAGRAAGTYVLLENSLTNIAANKKRRGPEQARKELQDELREIDEKHGLSAPDTDSINARTREARRTEVNQWKQGLKLRCQEICETIARALVSIAGDLHNARLPAYHVISGVPEDVRAGILMGTISYIAATATSIALNACYALRNAAPSATLDDVLFTTTVQQEHRAEISLMQPRPPALSPSFLRQELYRRGSDMVCRTVARALVSSAGDLYKAKHLGQDIISGVPDGNIRATVLAATIGRIANTAIEIAWDTCLEARGAALSVTLDDILYTAPNQQAQGAVPGLLGSRTPAASGGFVFGSSAQQTRGATR
ncbi:MAG: hypothetical protein AB8U72_01105 [Anaplasma ovis]